MKKLIIILYLLINSIIIFSQRITYQDLNKLPYRHLSVWGFIQENPTNIIRMNKIKSAVLSSKNGIIYSYKFDTCGRLIEKNNTNIKYDSLNNIIQEDWEENGIKTLRKFINNFYYHILSTTIYTYESNNLTEIEHYSYNDNYGNFMLKRHVLRLPWELYEYNYWLLWKTGLTYILKSKPRFDKYLFKINEDKSFNTDDLLLIKGKDLALKGPNHFFNKYSTNNLILEQDISVKGYKMKKSKIHINYLYNDNMTIKEINILYSEGIREVFYYSYQKY